MKVYIAGPMTGYQNYNREAFYAAAEHLRFKGYEVVNPAELDEGMTPEELATTPHWVFMRRDIKALLDCDLIYLLPGWTHSKGAALEARVAEGVGIDRLGDSDVEKWRTFEGEPETERHQTCQPVQGDGKGNEWCEHGAQVGRANAVEESDDERADEPRIVYPEGSTIVAPGAPAWEHAIGCDLRYDGGLEAVLCIPHGVDVTTTYRGVQP